MKRIISFLLLAALALTLLVSCTEEDNGEVYFARIQVKEYGDITIQLDSEQAPRTVKNFVDLAESGFYDGLTFHIAADGFIIQGGAPGSDYNRNLKPIKGEFSENGHENNISHKRGVVSMARGSEYNSANTQFFIMHDKDKRLDGKYAGFGYVVDGIEVVDYICLFTTPIDEAGNLSADDQPIIETIEIYKAQPIVINSDYDAYLESTSQSETSESTSSAEKVEYSKNPADFAITHKAVITIKDYGTIKLDLFGQEAPKTVENFVNLANDKFYDGLTFHRIIKDFMMQGGSADGTSSSSGENTIIGEFTENNHTNRISHVRGVISMARANDYNSASTQFFIMHKDSDSLDGKYAAFGYVTEGIEVVDAICEAAKPTDNNGTIEKAEQPIIESITIEEVIESGEQK